MSWRFDGGSLAIILLVVTLGYFLLKRGSASVSPVGAVPSTNTPDDALAKRLLLGLGTPRITPKRVLTVTGTISGCKPHYAPDGDLVFGLMPDAQFKNLLTPQNATHKCAGGGIWCEAMCVEEIKPLAKTQAWHQR